ncbi:hypothetical protein FANTH_12724 [Fusarium anthophilum]|uniref:Uncharacterized protein n=1 Tax=Fusarium anthophilum TaxID=48485 RepID=A0A8H5DRK3_9HYPO|nr:hypothetical protein FANTH_12724 [Fusarium anthophilum]
MRNCAWILVILPTVLCCVFPGIIAVPPGHRDRGYETHAPIHSALGAVRADIVLTMQAFFSDFQLYYLYHILSAETESVTSTTVPESASATETKTEIETESSTITSSETTTIAESATLQEPSVSTTLAITPIETSISEAPTTTTSVKQQPTNLIRNPGFEDPTFAPWETEKIANRGWLAIHSDTSRPGSLQCGVFDSSVPPTGLTRRLIQPYDWFVTQDIDPSKIIVGKEYRFSIFQKTTASSACTVQRLGCGAGPYDAGSSSFGGPLNTWALGAVSCTWNEAQLDAGPYVYVSMICASVTFSLDDAVLIERDASPY